MTLAISLRPSWRASSIRARTCAAPPCARAHHEHTVLTPRRHRRSEPTATLEPTLLSLFFFRLFLTMMRVSRISFSRRGSTPRRTVGFTNTQPFGETDQVKKEGTGTREGRVGWGGCERGRGDGNAVSPTPCSQGPPDPLQPMPMPVPMPMPDPLQPI